MDVSVQGAPKTEFLIPSATIGAIDDGFQGQTRFAGVKTFGFFAHDYNHLNSYPIEKGTEKGMKNLKIREAVDRGLQKHKEWDYGKGYRKEVDLGSGNRADAVKIEGDKGYIKELKPNNPRAIKKGERQLERYKEAAKKRWPYVKEWQTEVVTYD